MRKPGKASLAILGIAFLAIAVLLVGGGRSFGNQRPGLRPGSSGAAREGGTPGRSASPGGAEGQWLVAGPFSARGASGLSDPLDFDYLALEGFSPSGEAVAAPLSVGGNSSKLWRETEGTNEAESGEYGIDFNALFGPRAESVAYAYCEVESKLPGEALLRIGSDDGVKLWVNGKLLFANHVRRALRRGEDSLIAPLARGRNRILVKVEQARGEWGFSLSFSPLGAGRGDASVAELSRLEAQPDFRSFPAGGTIGGTVLPKPSPATGIAPDWAASVELVDSRGAVRARAEAPVGGRFSLPVPAGIEGPAGLRVKGRGPLAGLGSPAAAIFLGDLTRGRERALALARAPSAPKAAAARFPELPDPAATLEFLASSVEGSLPPSIVDFDLAIKAFMEIEALAGSAEAGGTFPSGLWRYAFASSVDGSIQPYSLYLPPGYRRTGSYGLVLSLHGASSSDVPIAASLAAAAPEDMIVLSPYCRGDEAYAGPGERDAIESMDLIRSRYAIDSDRVYICGSSMGGFGTWRLAKLYPWRFAAAAPFAGWTDLDMLENLLGMPLLAVHGDADPTIPIDQDRKAVDFLRANKGQARLEVLPGGGHNALETWTAEEGAGRLFSWFRRYRRASWPESLRVRTSMARAGKGAWASILGVQKPPRMAAIDARIVDERHIAVDTDNVSAFELDLRHPRLARGGRILVLADGVNLTADSGKPRARFELGAEGRFAPAPPSSASLPPNGGSGMVALFDAPLRIIYGTRKRDGAAEGEKMARAIADDMGSAGIGSVDISTDSDAAKDGAARKSNRLLIGTPDENSILAALMPGLPVAWKEDRFLSPDGKAKGPGLLLVCPDPSDPGSLLGILSPPTRGRSARGNAAVEFARGIFAPLGFQSGLGTCGYGTPDAVILSARMEALWTGYFDWRWERLVERESAKE